MIIHYIIYYNINIVTCRHLLLWTKRFSLVAKSMIINDGMESRVLEMTFRQPTIKTWVLLSWHGWYAKESSHITKVVYKCRLVSKIYHRNASYNISFNAEPHKQIQCDAIPATDWPIATWSLVVASLLTN